MNINYSEQKKNLEEELFIRIKLLSRGILPPNRENNNSDKFFLSMGVGAGPQGKTFYIYKKGEKNERRMISVPIYPLNHHLAKYALKTKFGDLPGTIEIENNFILKSISIPNFLSKRLRDGSIISYFAMMHCYKTCSTVLGYGCKHFDNNNNCIYCEIDPISIKKINLPRIVPTNQLSEALELVTKYDKIRSITITSGTFDDPDSVAKKYIELLNDLKKRISIPIHIQHEPLNNLELIKELAKLAESVGIFLEIFNEELRKKYCPGKAENSLEKYIRNWITAVKYFGRGNVMTTCLLGFGVNYNEILEKIDQFAEIGVRTTLMFTRFKSENLKNFFPSYLEKKENELFDLFIKAAEILKKHNIGFNRLKGSGCIGCQGCTAMMEAADLVNFEYKNRG